MHLAGYLSSETPNDWLTLVYIGIVSAAIAWALFWPPGDDE